MEGGKTFGLESKWTECVLVNGCLYAFASAKIVHLKSMYLPPYIQFFRTFCSISTE